MVLLRHAMDDLDLPNPPIVEMVLDVDCDLPPGFDLLALESPVKEALQKYPKVQPQYLFQQQLQLKFDNSPPEAPVVRQGLGALQFVHEDEKQLVQLRTQGYSFNRLAPYSSLDDYLPEIEAAWKVFIQLANPLQIRAVRLRYINRILLPSTAEGVSLKAFFKMDPLPDVDKLRFEGFLTQYAAIEPETSHRAQTMLVTQPAVDDKLPIILDNCVESHEPHEPEDWPWLESQILALRALKNRVFRGMLTKACLDLFR